MNPKKLNQPTILVVFGATGDLMQKKIIPALFNLFNKNVLPKHFKVFGFSRQKMNDDIFHKKISEIFINKEQKQTKIHQSFTKIFSYHSGFFQNESDYLLLKEKLKKQDDFWGSCSNKLFYLAVPPYLYEIILKKIADANLNKPSDCTRILIEKPFGKDMKTAKKMDRLLYQLFEEKQIYRIDHYLAKEALQDILVFRFSNNLFENNWNNKFIEKIEIKLWEKIGVEQRGAFYDGVGALRDVGQNHLLQMLALITMDRPKDFNADCLRKKREEILETLLPLKSNEIKKFTFRAQYKGYKKIEGVDPGSKTETYFKSVAFLSSSRWQGVPIILESGKRLKEQRKEIIIYLKHSMPNFIFLKNKEHPQNKIIFSIEPEEGVSFEFWRKKPGLIFQVEKRQCICYLRKEDKKPQYTEEYEKLLYDCIIGDQTLFVSSREIESMWRYIDPIINEWQKNTIVLREYFPETLEPVEESKYIDNLLPETNKHFKKEIGFIGLGKMGKNLALRLLERNWLVYGYNRTPEITKNLENEGLKGVYSLKDLIKKIPPPRIIWLMLPAGELIDEVIFGKKGLINWLKKGDILIDGGNSFYKDSIKRFRKLKEKGIFFVDVGVSGGPSGARYGASLMIGGERNIFEKIEPLFADLSIISGYQFFEGPGAGHFVKMIHNGIEYGMMQAIAEGFTILKHAKYRLNLKKVAEVYNHGSVIESRLIGWLEKALEIYGDDLDDISGIVAHTGEGEWTVKTAKEMNIKTKVIEEALQFRIESQKNPTYTGKILSALRQQFGGHKVTKERQ